MAVRCEGQSYRRKELDTIVIHLPKKEMNFTMIVNLSDESRYIIGKWGDEI